MLPRNGDSLRGASPWRCPVSSWRAAQHEPPRRAWRRRRGEQRRQRDADSRRRADPHESTGARPPAGGRRGAAASPRHRLGCRAELFAVDRARRAKQGVRDPRRPENESRIRRDGQCHQNLRDPLISDPVVSQLAHCILLLSSRCHMAVKCSCVMHVRPTLSALRRRRAPDRISDLWEIRSTVPHRSTHRMLVRDRRVRRVRRGKPRGTNADDDNDTKRREP